MALMMTSQTDSLVNVLKNIILRNDTEALKNLLKKPKSSFNIDQILSNGETLLQLAVRRRSVKMAKLLLKHGANVQLKNAKGDSYLHLAVRTGNVELVELFCHRVRLFEKNNVGYQPHELAKLHKYYKIAILLMQKFASVTFDVETLTIFLFEAVWDNDVDSIEYLLDRGADLNYLDPSSGITAFHLHFGKSFGCGLFNLFIEHGADVHLKSDVGINSLYYAAFFDHSTEVLEALFQMNVDSNDNGGLTILEGLFEQDTTESDVLKLNKLRVLVKYGVDVNALGESGVPPLCDAVKYRYYKSAEYLLDLGANVNGFGKYKPIVAAFENNDYDVVKLLIDRGADINFINDIIFKCICGASVHQFRSKVIKLLLEKRSNLLVFLDQHYSRKALFNF